MEQNGAGVHLQEVKDMLDAVVSDAERSDFEETISAIRRMSDPLELTKLVSEVLSDEEVLNEIAGRSYYHANNFLKLVLMTGNKSSWKLRLHMWHPRPGAMQDATEDIHSHRWDFTTALLVGEYRAREYRIGGGDKYCHLKYRPLDANQEFSLEQEGEEELKCVFEAVLPAGTVYHIDHEVLHCISRSEGKAAASLVLQRPAVTDFTNVYRSAAIGVGEKVAVPVERASVNQLRTELTQFLDWL